MDNQYLQTEISPLFILAAILLAVGYSWLLYSKVPAWSKKINLTLAAIRFVVVFTIITLIINPIFTQVKNKYIEPTLILAVDNSTSMLANDSLSALNSFREINQRFNDLSKDFNFDLRYLSFDNKKNENPDSIQFDHPITDLSKLLKDASNLSGIRNPWAIVLMSDGVYNKGVDPSGYIPRYPVHALGFGDTTKILDAILSQLVYNRIAYSGNSFTVLARLRFNGIPTSKVGIVISEEGKTLLRKEVNLQQGETYKEVGFQIDEATVGRHDYLIQIEPLSGEKVLLNNRSHAYIEVLESKVKILLAANSPHPDIKAIREAIERYENYQVSIYIPGVSSLKKENYDMAILHQIPHFKVNHNELFTFLQNSKTPTLYITGTQSNYNQLQQLTGFLSIRQKSASDDEVTPVVNYTFGPFNIDRDFARLLSKMPPVKVPFADFQIQEGIHIALFQQVGSVATSKPLLLMKGSLPRAAILIGEGYWNYRMQTYSYTGEKKLFDEFIESLIKYLAVKEIKEKFRLYPVQRTADQGDVIKLEAEVFDDIFNRSYGQPIEVKLRQRNGREERMFSFVNLETKPYYELKGLAPGVYEYEAKALIDNKEQTYSDRFTVRELNLELLNPVADHETLKEIAVNSSGTFFRLSQLDSLIDHLKTTRPPTKIESEEKTESIINKWWILFLICTLLCLEWASRKYLGSY